MLQLVGAILLGLLALPLTGGADAAQFVDREAIAMGTWLRVRVVASSDSLAHAAIEGVFARVAAVEARLTTWSPDSELSRVNRAPVGQPISVSSELSRWLRAARSAERATSGAFSPSAGALIDAWDLRGAGRRPSAATIRHALGQTEGGCFTHEWENQTVTRRCPDAWIDTGAFGKGIALDESATILAAAGVRSAVLDFGGQILIVGAPADVGIAHPADRMRPVLSWPAVAGAIATTSQSELTLAHEEGPIGHVLDPSSGRPVPAWGSVTVQADDGVTADAVATALFVMGPEQGVRWVAAHPDITAVFLVVGAERLIACGSADAVENLILTEFGSVAIGARSGPVVRCSPAVIGAGD